MREVGSWHGLRWPRVPWHRATGPATTTGDGPSIDEHLHRALWIDLEICTLILRSGSQLFDRSTI